MSKKIIAALGVGVALLLAVGLMVSSGGPAIAQDAPEPIPPETCTICHPDAGAKHQASYDELYQDGVILVSDLAYSFTAPDTHIVTFEMTKNGAPFDATEADSLGIYFVPFDGEAFQFDPAMERLSLKGDLTYDGEGIATSTLTSSEEAYAEDFSEVDGLVVLYGTDEVVGRLPARIRQAKYPFAALLETGGGVDYVSAANDAGCVKCHTDPYLKHGYIYAQVDGDAETDFYTCKACHVDNGEGGHFEWQLLVDDPELAAAVIAGEEELTPEQEEQYAYFTSLMNDVHMSHAMEFPYPQSMASCVTCHEGKLDQALADENFTVETCKSCHPVTGAVKTDESGEETIFDTTGLALATIVPESIHGSLDLATADCTMCHSADGGASTFSEIHTGYDKIIYTADGERYSDAISVTIDSADFDGEMLNVQFSAVEDPDLDGVDATEITPTIMVGLYGWDTKDYIIGPHERLFDDNEDGEISRASGDLRALEAEVGVEHPRVTTVSAEGGSWEVEADLTAWTDLIEDGTVRRVEIAVMPVLVDEEGNTLALDAPSRTFDLTTNEFDDEFYAAIVNVEDGCESCHDALATNYHSPDRGGNIVVCRLCHITKSGGSHLEMQSRSIDSYAHAIHAFQAFDIGDIDFNEPVEALHYEHHIEFPYPTHGVTDCASCHTEGTNDVPDQTKSLPGLLSASDTVETWDRSIPDIPEYVTGPASRACGGCHRADLINEDAVGELIPFNYHTKQGGYLIEAGEDDVETLLGVIDEIMALFGQ
jgi:OmcA/MtrC family decaheme c-type cytochrome